MKGSADTPLTLVAILAVLLTVGYGTYLFAAATTADRQIDEQRRRAIEGELASAREELIEDFEFLAVNDALFDAENPSTKLDGCADYDAAASFPVVGIVSPSGALMSLCEYGMEKDEALRNSAATAFGTADISWASRAIASRTETKTALSEFAYSEHLTVRGGRLYLVLNALIAPEDNRPLSATASPKLLFAAVNLSDRLLPDIAVKLGLDAIEVGDAIHGDTASLALEARNGAVTLDWPVARSYRNQLARTAPLVLVLTGLLLACLFVTLRRVSRLYRTVQIQEAQARYDALHDPMTGLANRAYFTLLIKDFLPRATTHTPLFVGMVDLDFFKSVNDTHGHDTGDALIKSVAARLSSVLSQQGVVARLGGDEFAFLVLAERSQMRELMASFYSTICAEVRHGEVRLQPSASIGIAIHVGGACTRERLMKAADLALYEAKAAGRGCYRVYRGGSKPRAEARAPGAPAFAAG